MSACLFVDVAACQDVPGGGFDVGGIFLFWDVVHPTTDAHRALGDYMYEQLREGHRNVERRTQNAERSSR